MTDYWRARGWQTPYGTYAEAITHLEHVAAGLRERFRRALAMQPVCPTIVLADRHNYVLVRRALRAARCHAA